MVQRTGHLTGWRWFQGDPGMAAATPEPRGHLKVLGFGRFVSPANPSGSRITAWRFLPLWEGPALRVCRRRPAARNRIQPTVRAPLVRGRRQAPARRVIGRWNRSRCSCGDLTSGPIASTVPARSRVSVLVVAATVSLHGSIARRSAYTPFPHSRELPPRPQWCSTRKATRMSCRRLSCGAATASWASPSPSVTP